MCGAVLRRTGSSDDGIYISYHLILSSMKKTVIAAAMSLAIVIPSLTSADHSSVTGVADIDLPATCTVTRSLGFGARGSEVECLQRMLAEHQLLLPSLATGYFGSRTKSALMAWQAEVGLPSTGFFGERSLAHYRGDAVSAAQGETTHVEVATSASSTTHMHAPLDITSWPEKPSVSIVLHADSMSGYNIEIVPNNFRFAPEHVNGPVIANEGHAHLMVNGKKIARVYGPWFHIGKEYFVSGTNAVLVTLNANDHSELSSGGSRIEATTTVTNH